VIVPVPAAVLSIDQWAVTILLGGHPPNVVTPA